MFPCCANSELCCLQMCVCMMLPLLLFVHKHFARAVGRNCLQDVTTAFVCSNVIYIYMCFVFVLEAT